MGCVGLESDEEQRRVDVQELVNGGGMESEHCGRRRGLDVYTESDEAWQWKQEWRSSGRNT